MAKPSRAQDPEAAALTAIEEALNLEVADAQQLPSEDALERQPHDTQALGQEAHRQDADRQDADRQAADDEQGEGEEAGLGAGVQLPKARTTPIDDWTAPDLNLPEHGEAHLDEAASDQRQAAAVVDQPAVPPRPAMRESAPLTPSVPAANENRQSVGAILQAMRVRPNPAPLIAALVLSIIWAGICAAYLASHRELIVPADGVPLYRRPELGFAILGIVGPIVFMFVTALMARRAQEMRLTARSMTEVAIRLAEPETVATEQVVTLSQAIRREVASLGDGIERALARASELETMMRSEVSNLERSYSDNERRIRSLIDGLSTQREEIVINSEKVRTAIVGAHESLSRDLATTSVRLAETVSDAATRVTASLGSKSEEIAFALSRTGSDLVQNLSDHGGDLVQRLAETGQAATTQVTTAGNSIAQSLAERIGEIDTRLHTTAESLLGNFESHGTAVTQRIEVLGQHFTETVTQHGDHIVARLTETGDRVHDTVNHAHEAFAQSSDRLGSLLTDAQQRLRVDLET
ncbi:MAG: apolipoprotein acyltransferase, partial [Methylobacteriaceae bacterium]|nr:apolipoprotein acyltransferase [Methylobacteriaceae bacterium]